MPTVLLALQPLGLALMGPLAVAVGVTAALYLCAGLKLLTLGSLLAVKDIRTLGPFPEGSNAAVESAAL